MRGLLPGLIALLLAACGAGTPTILAPEVGGFDPTSMVDVLPPDSIPAIRRPVFEEIAEARGWLAADEAVLALVIGRDARAYPISVLMRHEIVNDVVGGRTVAVSYCPLCNSAIVYDRRVRGDLVVTFITSGKLFKSNLVMLDEQTRSLWPQMLGRAVRGGSKGTELTVLPSSMVSFGEFATAHPDGLVLARPPMGAYGDNLYPGYDTRAAPFDAFFFGLRDVRLPAMERVVGVSLGSASRAYPFRSLLALGSPAVVHDTVAGLDVVVFHGGGQRSALDAVVVSEGRTVGSSGVFTPRARGRALTFRVEGRRIVDQQTMSTWNQFGHAVSGELRGERLPEVAHMDAFWFAWAAFEPRTGIWDAQAVIPAR